MSLFSLFRKNKQEDAASDSAFYSRAESESQAVRPRKRKSAARADRNGEGGEDNAPVDPVLPEKKRARRRLVGAVALVLAVVIGLPMVLDSEPKPLPDDLTVEIPARDKPAPARNPVTPPTSGTAASKLAPAAALDKHEELVDTAPSRPAPLAAASAPVPLATPAEDRKPVDARKSAEPKATEPKAAEQKAAEQKVTEQKVAEAHKTETAAKPHPKSGAEPAVASAAAKSADAARARAILDAGNDGKTATYTVQVAALASMEKVNELRGRLKGAGIASYTQKVATESGERIRIRIGPLNSKEEVDRMRAKLTEIGLSGKLVSPTS